MANPDRSLKSFLHIQDWTVGCMGTGGSNQNNHNDGRWNDGDTGEHSHVVKAKGLNVLKDLRQTGLRSCTLRMFRPAFISYRAVGMVGFGLNRFVGGVRGGKY